jgi:hypothetical protein
LVLRVDTLERLENLSSDPVTIAKSWQTFQWLVLRIQHLFKKQVKILEKKCLAFYEDKLLDLMLDLKGDFQAEKNLLHQRAMLFFQKNIKHLDIPPWTESRNGTARMEKILVDFAVQFKESPVVQLHMHDRLKKQMRPSNLKEKSLVIGFGLTAALRPPGFGNFQFISHYSHGPHVFNLSLVNDRDAALQEGQSKVQRLRIQPSLNFEIDL